MAGGSSGTERAAPSRLAAATLATVAAVTTLATAVVIRSGCVSEVVGTPTASRWCWTQVPALYFDEDLTQGRLPYLQPCESPVPGQPCDEYPVLTMYSMWLARTVGGGVFRFFLSTAALLLLSSAITAWILGRLVGLRAMYFALAPALALYGLMNWDFVGVAFAIVGLAAFINGRNGLAGAAIGLAAAVKFFPGLFLIPMALERLRTGHHRQAATLVFSCGTTWALVNAPFAILASEGWWTFFRFNVSRQPDIDTPFYWLCEWASDGSSCLPVPIVNASSLVILVLSAALVWRARARQDPDFPVWTFAFPLLVLFLLSNKVYSPQYDLWLLPWFSLVLPHPGLFAAFSSSEVAVFLTRYNTGFAFPAFAFPTSVLVRDLVLVLCVVAYVRGWGSNLGARLPLATSPGRERRAARVLAGDRGQADRPAT